MGKMQLIVPCLFGLEGLAADELRRLNMENVTAENGRVLFSGDCHALARANLCLRTGERVLILLAQYFAFTSGPAQGFSLLTGTFANWDFAKAGELLTAMLGSFEWYLVIASMVIVLIVDLACEAGVDVNGKLAKGNFMLRWAVLIAMILAVLLFGCYGADFDGAAFLYTNF